MVHNGAMRHRRAEHRNQSQLYRLQQMPAVSELKPQSSSHSCAASFLMKSSIGSLISSLLSPKKENERSHNTVGLNSALSQENGNMRLS